jgi:hypothetical protein
MAVWNHVETVANGRRTGLTPEASRFRRIAMIIGVGQFARSEPANEH